MGAESRTDVLLEAEAAVRRDGRAALCQIVRVEGSTPGKPGWKLLLRRDGGAVGNLGGGAFEALVKADATKKLGEDLPVSELKRYYFTEKAVRGEPTGMVCGGMAEVFVEVLEAAPLLLVCGGGPVGQAVAQAGDLAGFEVAVVEDRSEFLEPKLFPPATELVKVDRRFTGEPLAPFHRRQLFVAILTRCWETDSAALGAVLRQGPEHLRYLGLMGSKRKVERVRREVEASGLCWPAIPFHAPIGLAVGGDTPGEIAISILAEVLQVRHARAAEREERRAS
jgi:xanthine dehydrogenase accessory factor